jgi:hypothetical protein
MAKTDWKMGDTVMPDDLKAIGQEINENASAIADHINATTGVHGATSAATPNTIVQRDADGRFKASAPVAADDVARKAEVDQMLPKSGGVVNGLVEFANGKIQIGSSAGIKRYLRFDGAISEDDQTYHTLWHSGNDGAGSGLDADTVRGYLPINKNGDTMGGPLISDANGFRTPQADRPLITKGWDPFTSGHLAGLGRWGIFMEQGRMGFGLPNNTGQDPKVFRYRENSTIEAEYKLWHEGNFPIESGSWTPNVQLGGINVSFASRSGNYTRIGNLLYWSFDVELSSKNSGTGVVVVGAFPFPLAYEHSSIAVGTLTNAYLPSGANWVGLRLPHNGATWFGLDLSGNVSKDTRLNGSHISNNTTISASGVNRIWP